MTPADSHLLLRAFCDELARCGITDACTSPGSRSAPLVLALAREPRLRCWSHLDERCAGFFALGLAKATGHPAAVACTSGTAAANLTPAVHEAREARVPLIVLTADRPPELREVGAGQVIDQVKLFGTAAKWFFEVGNHEATRERLRWIRALACRACWTALYGRPGVVHLNFALREPLVPEGALPMDASGRPDGDPWLWWPPDSWTSAAAGREVLLEAIGEARHGVVVAGRFERHSGLAGHLRAFSEGLGFPLLADPLSGARTGRAAIAHYDALLRDPRFAAEHRPDFVLRVGDLPTSKPLRQWLADLDARQVAVDPEGGWHDPSSSVREVIPLDPGTALGGFWEEQPRDPSWLAAWESADRRAVAAIRGTLGNELSEPLVAAELGVALPGDCTLVVASSMPVRDVETFFPVRDDPARVLANRGANGIDGTVSTAFGVAASGARTVLLIGDVALAHDIGGLLAASRLGLDLTIVLLNNDGGGIFHFLPVAGEADAFEEHVATPHGLDFSRAAALYGCEHHLAADMPDFRAALERSLTGRGTTIIEVRTDRAENLELHRQIERAVGTGLS